MPSALPYDRLIIDMSEEALRKTAERVNVMRPGVKPEAALAVIHALLILGWQAPAFPEGESAAEHADCLCPGEVPHPERGMQPGAAAAEHSRRQYLDDTDAVIETNAPLRWKNLPRSEPKAAARRHATGGGGMSPGRLLPRGWIGCAGGDS
jgi:hypothetical protein